ncbi:thermonuclease family protein [Gemmobacter sp.]|uniref:thermonuclease family protein n=1 Tax=Gemmobacter sp. TaxID=1898957 RepID=UPI002AFE87C1|nr:thermonuclease family protein [Gemmobacter sp.]
MEVMRIPWSSSAFSSSGWPIIVKMLVPILVVLVVLVSSLSAQTDTVSGKVRHVTDGDTFSLRGIDQSIRVWGLDAPERNERGASAATSILRGLISGQSLTCRVRDIDRYGRIVGQCFLPDGRDIAAVMIAAGVAREYCRFSGGYYRTCRRK